MTTTTTTKISPSCGGVAEGWLLRCRSNQHRSKKQRPQPKEEENTAAVAVQWHHVHARMLLRSIDRKESYVYLGTVY